MIRIATSLIITFLVISLHYANAQERVTGQQVWSFAELSAKQTKQFVPRSVGGPYNCVELPVTLKEASLRTDLNLNKKFVADANFALTVTLEIKAMRNALPEDLAVLTFSPVTLQLNPQQPSATFVSSISSQYEDIDYIKVNIVSVTPGFAQVVDQLQLKVYTLEDLGFDVRSTTVTLQEPQMQNGKVNFQWTASCNNVPYYEVQVLRLFNTEPSYATNNQLLSAKVDWSRALSVYTKDSSPSLSLTLAEGTGYYLWRVRPVGNYFGGGSNNPLNLGNFGGSEDYDNGSTVEHSDLSGADSFYFTQPDADKNKMFSRVYVENGKMAESMAYADGFLNVHQQQIFDPHHQQVITSQNIYDNYGRNAISVMSVPVNQQALVYAHGILQNNSGAPYSAKNFATRPSPDPAQGLASNYYSDANPDATIPSAGGYPFLQTRFDAQGRVAEVASPGEQYKIGTSHTVKTFYEAAKQSELNELFGQEAPNAWSVTKVITFDENRTASVAYYQGKKVLATSLGVTGAGVLEDLPSENNATATRHEDVLGEPISASEDEIVSVTDHFFLMPQTVQFHYTLSSEAFQVLCAPALNLEKGVDYSGKIEVINKTTGAIVSTTSFEVNNPGVREGVAVDESFSFVVEEGPYQIRRVLRTNTTAANGKKFLDNYLAEARATLEQSLQQEPTLTQIFTYLDNNDPNGLYQFLNVSKDESGYWPADVTLALQACCSINIPVQVCPDPCASDNLDFEQYLLTKYPSLSAALNGFFFRSGTPLISGLYANQHWLNDLIQNMMSDGYSCKELWGCWQQTVDQFGDVGTYLPGEGLERQVDPNYDLLKAFLDCTGTQYQGFSALATNWVENAHKYFKYSKGSKKDCEEGFGYDAASPWAPDNRFAPKDQQQWLVFANCVNAMGVAGEKAALEHGGEVGASCLSLKSQAEILACLEDTKKKSENDCQGLCESRYGSIILQLIQAYLDEGLTVQLTPGAEGSYDIYYSELDCKAQGVIESCQQMCTLSYVTDKDGQIVGLGTEEEKVNMRRAMIDRVTVSIDACPADFESSGNNSTDGLSKWLLESSLENFLKNVSDEGGCWNYASAISGKQLSMLVNGMQPCGPGSVFVKPRIAYSLIVDGCRLIFEQRVTAEKLCRDAKQDFISLLNAKFAGLSAGESTDVFGNEFPEGIALKTSHGNVFNVANNCFKPEKISIHKIGNINVATPGIGTTPEAERCNPNPDYLGIYYLPGSHFVLAENGSSIYLKRNGVIIDVLCFTLCCDENGKGNGLLIGSVDANFDCSGSTCGPVCVKYEPLQLDPIPFNPPTCQTETVHHLREVINAQLEKFIGNQLKKIEEKYRQAFLETKDELVMEYSNGQHHYTLYYYDRAGNKIRTVAPKGISKVESRDALPHHNFVTTYEYNSLGQLMRTHSPDGGDAMNFYDKLGRPRFSVSANQMAAHNRFTYLLYDNLGRVAETGEAITDVEISETKLRSKALADVNYPNLSDADITSFRHVTQQHFNEPYPDFAYADYEQENLIGNLSYQISDADGNKATTDDQIINLFSYDVHNNVKWSAQITPGLGISVTEYEYNLLSGIITEIRHNPGRKDQFFQRFNYGVDNRLTGVETSADYVVWSTDATYEYAAHGPLKRMELGTDKVQGVDYTYTLEGSLKALNHPALSPLKDPGNDGANGVATDAFGMVLEHHANDFIRTGSVFNESSARIGALQNPAGMIRNLYDGNITAMITNTQSVGGTGLQNGYQATQFVYDELGRLKQSVVSQRSNGNWITDGSYGTTYSYDENGNITSLNRKGHSALGLNMDDLSYSYQGNNNRLQRVTDAVQGDAYTSDLSTQPANNYQYDDAGQLIADISEGITIEWTWFSKPKKVTKTNGTVINFIYGNDHQKIVKKVFTPDGKTTSTFYIHDASGKVISIYERVDKPMQGGNLKTTFTFKESPITALGRVGMMNHELLLKEVSHDPLTKVELDLAPFNNNGVPDDILFSYKLSTLTAGTYSFNSFTEAQILNEDQTAGPVQVKDVVANPTATLTFGNSVAQLTSENILQMSASFNEAGKKIFTAVAAKLNADQQVVVKDSDNAPVPFNASVGPNLYHETSLPLVIVSKPGSECIQYLYTQTRPGLNDVIYRHTLDACAPGNGTLENPRGQIVETNVVVHNKVSALRFGSSVQAIQNMGKENATRLYFLRSSATQVQLSVQTVDSNGNFVSQVDGAVLDGTPIGKIKVSPDGRQLLFSYLKAPVINQVRMAAIRRVSIGTNGALDLVGEIEITKDLLDAEFTADGKFIYYATLMSEPAPVAVKGANPAKRYHLRRYEIKTRADEFVEESFSDEIFNGKHLAIQRGADRKLYISAAGHRSIVMINNPSADVNQLIVTGVLVGPSAQAQNAYLNGAFATTAFDMHRHGIETEGTYNSVRNTRQYEIKDHLDNVNVVVSDMRAADGSATVVSANNYYPYGMIMPGRNYNSADYRYGFNGMEKDDELKGSGNSYDFGARLYDPRVGRWLTRDPLAQKYAGLSDYNAFLDNPVFYVDPDGKDAIAWREGNTIHIAATIYITGYKASNSKAKEIQTQIMNKWGKDFHYKDYASGVTYNVEFNVNVRVAPDYITDVEDLGLGENLITLKSGAYRSNVNSETWRKGNWAYYPNLIRKRHHLKPHDGTYAHEFGHLLHLEDLNDREETGGYTGLAKKYAEANDLMAYGTGEVSQWTINELASFALSNEVILNDMYENEPYVEIKGRDLRLCKKSGLAFLKVADEAYNYVKNRGKTKGHLRGYRCEDPYATHGIFEEKEKDVRWCPDVKY